MTMHPRAGTRTMFTFRRRALTVTTEAQLLACLVDGPFLLRRIFLPCRRLGTSSGNAGVTYVDKSTGRRWSLEEPPRRYDLPLRKFETSILQCKYLLACEVCAVLDRPDLGDLWAGHNPLPASSFDTPLDVVVAKEELHAVLPSFPVIVHQTCVRRSSSRFSILV